MHTGDDPVSGGRRPNAPSQSTVCGVPLGKPPAGKTGAVNVDTSKYLGASAPSSSGGHPARSSASSRSAEKPLVFRHGECHCLPCVASLVESPPPTLQLLPSLAGFPSVWRQIARWSGGGNLGPQVGLHQLALPATRLPYACLLASTRAATYASPHLLCSMPFVASGQHTCCLPHTAAVQYGGRMCGNYREAVAEL